MYNTREVRDVLTALQPWPTRPTSWLWSPRLRSSLYGCGDDDLAHWRLACRGRFSVVRPQPESCPADHPVADGIAHLAELHRAKLGTQPARSDRPARA